MAPLRPHPPRSCRLRRGRRSVPGGVYLVTFCTWQRTPLFLEHDPARRVARALSDSGTWPAAMLLAWVLMPDHWHGLIQLEGDETLSRAVARAKAAATRAWRERSTDIRPLWSAGFHDRALRRDASLVDAARYVVLNPVRAGLASTCAGYPYWDAVWVG